MCNALTVHLNDEPIYDIFFANDFNSLPELLAGQGIADRRVCIVTESNVAMRSGISLMENAKN